MPMPTHWQADTMDSRRFSMRLTGGGVGPPTTRCPFSGQRVMSMTKV
jgi:hypothetical protein